MLTRHATPGPSHCLEAALACRDANEATESPQSSVCAASLWQQATGLERWQEHTMFCIFAAMSSVRSAVAPPAPQVMPQKVSPNDAMRSCLSKRFSTPCGALHKSVWSRPYMGSARFYHLTFILTPHVRCRRVMRWMQAIKRLMCPLRRPTQCEGSALHTSALKQESKTRIMEELLMYLIRSWREEFEGEEGPSSADGLVHFVDDLHDRRSPWQLRS